MNWLQYDAHQTFTKSATSLKTTARRVLVELMHRLGFYYKVGLFLNVSCSSCISDHLRREVWTVMRRPTGLCWAAAGPDALSTAVEVTEDSWWFLNQCPDEELTNADKCIWSSFSTSSCSPFLSVIFMLRLKLQWEFLHLVPCLC